jgi:Uncharacterized protein conserved in bacteria (DUF2059)
MRRFVAIISAAIIALVGVPVGALAQEGDEGVVAAVDPVKLELAREVVNLGFPEETREAVFFAAVDQTVLQMREASLKAYGLEGEDPGALAVLDGWIDEYITDSKAVLQSHIPSIMEGMTLSYAAMFTTTELRDIRDFVATPSGQRFFELSSAVMAQPNFAAANQAYMNEVQSQLPAAVQDLRGRLQEYFSEKAASEG